MMTSLPSRCFASFFLYFLLVGGLWILALQPVLATDNPNPGPRRSVAAVLDLRSVTPGTLVQLADAQGRVSVSVRASVSGAHLPFAGLPAGRYTVYTDAPEQPGFVVEFNGRRITGTADLPGASEHASAIDTATHGN